MPDTSGPTPPNGEPRRFTFRPRHRLTHARQFKAVYDARMRKARGGLIVFSRPNGLPHHRLGLAVSARTIPKAADRNRIKRLIREWFRLNQPLQPASAHDPDAHPCFDVVVSVRSGRLDAFATLSNTLNELLHDSAAQWQRRQS